MIIQFDPYGLGEEITNQLKNEIAYVITKMIGAMRVKASLIYENTEQPFTEYTGDWDWEKAKLLVEKITPMNSEEFYDWFMIEGKNSICGPDTFHKEYEDATEKDKKEMEDRGYDPEASSPLELMLTDLHPDKNVVYATKFGESLEEDGPLITIVDSRMAVQKDVMGDESYCAMMHYN